jgi:hypothetical protein
MKVTLSLLIAFLLFESICFSQTLQKEKEEILKTDTFLVWEILDLQEAENTGFMYQDCNFIALLLQSIKLGIIRPFANDSLKIRLSQENFLERINQKNTSSKIILKNKMKYQVDEIVYQEILAVSIYSEKGNLICAFRYEELKANLLLDNSDAMICLGENLKIPLIEVFNNHSFKTLFLRKIKKEYFFIFNPKFKEDKNKIPICN